MCITTPVLLAKHKAGLILFQKENPNYNLFELGVKPSTYLMLSRSVCTKPMRQYEKENDNFISYHVSGSQPIYQQLYKR